MPVFVTSSLFLQSEPFAPDHISVVFRQVSDPWNANQIVTLILGLFWVRLSLNLELKLYGIFCDYISQMTPGTKRRPSPLSVTSVFTVRSGLQFSVLEDGDEFAQGWISFVFVVLDIGCTGRS